MKHGHIAIMTMKTEFLAVMQKASEMCSNTKVMLIVFLVYECVVHHVHHCPRLRYGKFSLCLTKYHAINVNTLLNYTPCHEDIRGGEVWLYA
jgi:hypothetical protein